LRQLRIVTATLSSGAMSFRFIFRPRITKVAALCCAAPSDALRCAHALWSQQCANVAVIFALSAIPLVAMVGVAVDYGRATQARAKLQNATDSAALAVSVSAAQNPNQTKSQLQALANNYLTAAFSATPPQVTEFHVCTPVQNDCNNNGVQMKMGSVLLSTTLLVNRTISGMIPISIGSAGKSYIPVTALSVATVNTPQTIALNIVFDTSASMIVGATTNDVNLISNWVSHHWNLVKPGDPAPNYPGGDNPPCAFACHDVGASTGPSDIALGLTHAHSAGATTRFDVMVAAAQQLISHVQAEQSNNVQFQHNTYLFNVLSFDSTLHQWGSPNMSFTAASNAVKSVTLGLDTHLSATMAQLITQIGTQGTGYSSLTPLKFVILITDGLQSDRGANWSGGHWGWDNAWGYNTHFGGYDTTIDTNQCQTIKNNGIILAVLETPYVPLTGQSPNVAPYEKTVRKVIYPNGPNTPSAVSQALAQCASQGYYFQATNASDIATGFITLTDKFLYNVPYLAQ
jgi:Flp pilus assembly protein TadG